MYKQVLTWESGKDRRAWDKGQSLAPRAGGQLEVWLLKPSFALKSERQPWFSPWGSPPQSDSAWKQQLLGIQHPTFYWPHR